ncbi:hypothetical protein LLOABG_LLOABG_07040, partial [Dysosmobacter welbionis]
DKSAPSLFAGFIYDVSDFLFSRSVHSCPPCPCERRSWGTNLKESQSP